MSRSSRWIVCWALCVAFGIPRGAWALVPVDVLQQPAAQVRQPQNAVYLAATEIGERLIAVGEHGLIAVSDDHGASWRQVVTPVSATLTGVQFVTAKVGWVIGHSGVVLGTRDGGESWDLLLDGRRAAQAMLEQAKRVDDGSESAEHRVIEAQRMVSDGPDKPLLGLYFRDEKVGFVVGAYNLILRTDDGGQHWQAISDRLDNPRGLHLYAIAAQGATLYIAAEQGLLLRSDDGGEHFQSVALPYSGSLFVVQPFSRDSVVVAGLRGNALVSDDRGVSWRTLSGAPPVSFIASFTVEGDVQLLNQTGQRFSVTGDRLVPLDAPTLGPVTGAVTLNSQQWLMLTLQGLVRQPNLESRP
jgi:photosystem II stability/assembly factor-like uncharacterized protein